MNTKQLKAKVLDLAIHGKLLSPETVAELKKSPDYETADVLLEKIRKEKEEKIAKGELKRDKKDSYIFVGDDKRHYEKFADGTVKDIEDEIPFDVPEGWAWCRLGEIAFVTAGKTPSKDAFVNEGIPYIKMYNLRNQRIDFDFQPQYIKREIHEKVLKKSQTEIGDLIMNIVGPPLGKLAFIPESLPEANFNQAAVLIRPYRFKSEINKYLFYFLSEMSEINSIATKGSAGQVNISLTQSQCMKIPLPPLAEQERIVSAIENIFAQIDTLEQNKFDLQVTIKQAKSKILDLAIHGKLVPQDPNDEPADVLLEKLRAEKEAKIKAGELKRDKNDSYIYKSSTDNCHYEKFKGKDAVCIEDEIPFEIPESWQWSKLGQICTKLVDGDHNPPKGIEEKTNYIMASSRNINHDTVEDLENVRYLTKEVFETENQRTKAKKGDIFFTSVGTLGRSCIYDGNLNICFQRSVSVLNTQIENKYLKYFFDSSFYQNYVVEHATGTAQQGFYLQEMSESYVAVPPISEQQRIVSKIEELFTVLDQIQNNLI